MTPPDVKNDNAKKSAQRRQQLRKLKGMKEEDLAHDVHVDDPYSHLHRRWSEEEQGRIDDYLERRADINEHGSRHAGSAFMQHLDEDHAATLKSMKGHWHSQQISKFLIAWDAFERSATGQILTANPDLAEKLKKHLLRSLENDVGKRV
jgi:hypothetical protein